MNSLLVFDYETTGLDTSRDRPMQFACLRTDLDLNVIGAPTTLYCRPAPDHLPDPNACVVTGITPQLCEEVGLPELQFVDDVHRQLSLPGTIAFGYNSIAFDDEITRFMLWRNLIDPYGREWKDGCGRWDLIGTVRAVHALRPETLEWPRDAAGKVSFKLERLSRANGLLHESAHDALSDVLATIALARTIRERQPQLYAHCFALHDKALAMQEMDPLHPVPFIHVGRGAPQSAGVRIMMPVAMHPTNRNEIIAWDLSEDPRQLLDIDAETLRRRLFTHHEVRPAGFRPMPLHCVAANRSPAVFRDLTVLSRERAAELGVDVGAALANVADLREVLEAVDLALLLQVAFARDAAEADPDPEEALYAGFVGADRRLLDQLRALDADGLAAVRPGFSDPRLDALFLRYKARHFPQTLSSRERDKWEEHRFDKLVTGIPGSRTVAMVRDTVDACRFKLKSSNEAVDPAKYRILDEVLAYTNRLAAEIDPFGAVPAPAPVEPEPPAPAPAPAPLGSSAATPVQPDLFGGADVTQAPRRARSGRR
jgi:exodeoxyribonuclease-1